MDLNGAIRALHLTCAALADGQANADQQVADSLRRLVAGLDQRLHTAFIRHAYWEMPVVPTSSLVAYAGGPERLRDAVGRGPLIGSCDRCGRGVRARDRQDVGSVGPPRCRHCRNLTRAGPDAERAPVAAQAWEFEPFPAVWQPRTVSDLATGRRVWADHYPDRDAPGDAVDDAA